MRKGACVPQPLSSLASQRRGLEVSEPLLRCYVLAPGEGQLLLRLAGPEGSPTPYPRSKPRTRPIMAHVGKTVAQSQMLVGQ